MRETNTSALEFDYILRIAERALPLYAEHNVPDSKLTISMDLEYWHAAAPIDLCALLSASAGDFAHDIFGIRRHIDRKTCKPESGNCFAPRTSLL